jgi:dephospho-CoA kinase
VGRWKDKYVIGITGNIATGKSLVRSMLQHLGAYTIDADGLAHQVMVPNAPAYRPVIEWFGKWIVSADGRIDRGRLGAVAFAHPDALKQLEAITHPVIGRAIDTLITRAPQKVVVVEAIKLLEGQLAAGMDAIWVVDAPVEAQLQRLMKTRGLTEADARKRITVQNPQADKLKAASVVINNNGDPNNTFAQVQAAWSKIGTSHVPPKLVTDTLKTVTDQEVGEVTIRRPKRTDMAKIAAFLNKSKGTRLTESDIMLSFSETSYLVAETKGDIIGAISFVVENLITQSREIILPAGVPIAPVLPPLIEEMEEASKLLQSEVAFIYLREAEAAEVINLLKGKLGYQPTKIEEIKFPAWREAVRSSQPQGTIILSKKLREERVLTPI